MEYSKLIEQIINGDPSAQRELITEHHLALKKVIISYAGWEFHEDILQETWIKIFKNIQTFQYKSDIKTWMVRIAINVANTYHNKESAFNTTGYDNFEDVLFHENGSWKQPIHSWQSHSPEDNHSRDQLQTVLDKEILLLADKQKAVLTLHDIQGLSLKIICNILEISESNVRVLLHRARQQLLLKIDSYYKGKKC